ncbi:hypothetical protein GCM10022222_08600 [Amycolatopsis ultiminotia]|uniref:NitT/TauT family transport system substrate-binding protein n=1 Tax=Amycolatopsis ultiminotia TaxID=543629 RepID=A0ABP6V6D6_9PSEU
MPRKTLRRFRLALPLFALAATACGPGGAASGGDTITLGLPVQATTLGPVYLAGDQDLWQEHGLTVKTVTFKGDAELAKAVLSGDVDVAVGSPTGPLTAEEAGQDVKVLYGGFDMTAFSWYAVPEIRNVAQGKGKNWGVTTIGSSTDLLTRFAAAKAGLDPDRDIKVVQGGASAARLAAMKAGQLQANIFTEPQTIYAQQAGYHKILDLADLVDSYPMHVTWSKAGFLTDDPGRAGKFVDTLSQAMQMTKDRPDDAAQSIAKANKISVDDARASMAEWIDQLHPDGRMPSAKAMDDFWQMGLQGKVFRHRLPDSQWLDSRFLPKTG